MNTRYSVIGLGKLGASMAAAIASRGFHTVGVDVNRHVVESLEAGRAPVLETGLQELISAHAPRLRATSDYRDAVLDSDVSFVVVPTPSDEQGGFSLQYAARAFAQIGRALREKAEYHLVVLTSTVLPGSTRYGLLPILERESGKACGRDFGVCYGPEFIALGSVIHDFLHPDFTLVGEFDERSGGQLEECYAQIILSNAPCRRMSLENAELTKIALNTYVTTKITFANLLADLCERIPGGDVDVVSNALGCDTRIGRKYLTGALGYGGPCFPRDNAALAFLARALGTRAELAEATDRCNRMLVERVVDGLRPIIHRGTNVAVLGLAYKPGSHIIEGSQGIYLAKALSKCGARVVAYDPLAGKAAQDELRDQAVILDSISDCISQAEVILITAPDPEFRKLRSSDFADSGRRATVVDFWRILGRELSNHPSICYIAFGRSHNDAANALRLSEMWKDEATVRATGSGTLLASATNP